MQNLHLVGVHGPSIPQSLHQLPNLMLPLSYLVMHFLFHSFEFLQVKLQLLFFCLQQPFELSFLVSQCGNQFAIFVFEIFNVERVYLCESFFDIVKLYFILSLVFVYFVSELSQLIL